MFLGLFNSLVAIFFLSVWFVYFAFLCILLGLWKVLIILIAMVLGCILINTLVFLLLVPLKLRPFNSILRLLYLEIIWCLNIFRPLTKTLRSHKLYRNYINLFLSLKSFERVYNTYFYVISFLTFYIITEIINNYKIKFSCNFLRLAITSINFSNKL